LDIKFYTLLTFHQKSNFEISSVFSNKLAIQI
jgi:hypothetical protein